MPLDTINNGEAASSVRSKLNTAIGQVNTNTTDITGKQPLDTDLTTIAGLTPSNDDFMQRKSNAWANRTVAQVKVDLAINNVDNTSDANKPVSTATQTALDAKQDENGVDTTIWRVVNTSSVNINPVVGDNKKMWVVTLGAAGTFTIPENTTQAFDIGTEMRIINHPSSTNNLTVTAAGAVITILANGASLAMAAKTGCHIVKVAIDTWVVQY